VSLAKRLEALNQVYQIYDDYSVVLDPACEANGLIVNWELKVLMIPPEHREKIEPILQQLRQFHL
jgi:hypothetical protein